MSCAVLAAACLLLAAAAPNQPSDYRNDHYESPTPSTLQGGQVLSTIQARELWRRRRAVFIDVLPRPPRPAGLPAGTIWRDKPRADIPGSIWLPNTGYGALPSSVAQYFKDGLNVATVGDPSRELVFYCKPDCWMSWNAAKRALTLGYTNVDWYPGGDGAWTAAGLPLAPREPFVAGLPSAGASTIQPPAAAPAPEHKAAAQ